MCFPAAAAAAPLLISAPSVAGGVGALTTITPFVTGGLSTFQMLSLGLGILGTGFQAYGAYRSAQAQKAQSEYQAGVARNNQIIAERNAQDAIKRGQAEEARHRLQVAQLKGTQRSVLAASGVELDDGSALDILGDTAELGELDALTIRSNAEREAYQARVQGMNYAAEAGLHSYAAESTNPFLSAGSALFSGLGSVADKWYSYKRRSG